MALQGSLTRRLDDRPPRSGILPRLQAVLQGPVFDAELATGVRPSASAAHQLRADHLMRRSVRRRIAAALNRSVEDACHPDRALTSQAPLCRDAVGRCSSEIRELARLVATLENPPLRGIAIAFQLAFDGSGALFFRPDTGDGFEHLANTLQAAHMALRVSADL